MLRFTQFCEQNVLDGCSLDVRSEIGESSNRFPCRICEGNIGTGIKVM